MPTLRDYKINSYHTSCKLGEKFRLYLALTAAYQMRAADASSLITLSHPYHGPSSLKKYMPVKNNYLKDPDNVL